MTDYEGVDMTQNSNPPTITEFLEARIAEDKAAAAAYERFANGIPVARKHKVGDDRPELRMPDPKRLLAECQAKRNILWNLQRQPGDPAALYAVGCLALVYRDHPDYDANWAL